MERQQQGSSNGRDTHDGSLTAVEELELTRRAQQRVRDMTLRRRQQFLLELRKVEAAERAEQEAAAAATRAQEVVDRSRDSVAAATPPPPVRGESVNSRSERPGDDAFLDGSVTFMASLARVEFSAKLRAAVVAKASALLTDGQENVAASAGAPVGNTGVVHNGQQLLEGSAKGRPDPRFGRSPETGPRRGPGHRFMANPAGRAGVVPPDEEAARRQPRSGGPPPWG